MIYILKEKMRCLERVQKTGRRCKVTAFGEINRCYQHGKKYIKESLARLNIIVPLARSSEELNEQIYLLLEDPKFTDSYGRNGIHRAILHNDIEDLQIAINSGADINQYKFLLSLSPLVTAIQLNRSEEVLRMLLKAGANVNEIIEQYSMVIDITPLSRLIFSKHINGSKLVRLFLEFGAISTSLDVITAKKMLCYNCLYHFKPIKNLIEIQDKWNDKRCIEWRNSIMYRFAHRIPVIGNKTALFQAFIESEAFELSHILCMQKA
jgi:hypothetical protein